VGPERVRDLRLRDACLVNHRSPRYVARYRYVDRLDNPEALNKWCSSTLGIEIDLVLEEGVFWE
jgi:hypothetical protein